LGWLRFQTLHAFIGASIARKEQGYASYRVVCAAWHQGLFTSKKATPEQLRFDRNLHHDLMHAGVEPRSWSRDGGGFRPGAAKRSALKPPFKMEEADTPWN
jgi:hypothetical protein